jgi:beta-glucuronidase
MKLKNYLNLLLLLATSVTVQAQEFKAAETKNIALFPQQNETRNAINISGIWKFKKDENNAGEKEQWYNGLINSVSIAVPGSYNEQLEEMRDYLGLVWYEQTAFIPKSWTGQKIFLRIGSANHAAKVWVNGVAVGKHDGGSLPFAFDVSSYVALNANNRITIQTENILKPGRVPTGGSTSNTMFSNNPKTNYDFFPYAGLQRAVWLYSTPKNAITDVTVTTNINGADGEVIVTIKKEGAIKTGKLSLSGDNKTYESNMVFNADEAVASIKVPAAHLWNTTDPYLYNLTVNVGSDVYNLNIGIRTIAVTDKQILLNGKPVFLKGFGKHEDFPIFGKGLAAPVLIKDYSLLKWIGANSYRTSHYPYDEEYMNMADKEGILIIDEIPAVGLYFDNDEAMANERKAQCMLQIKELVARDKNHPAIIMWNLANEPLAKKSNLPSGKIPSADEFSLGFFKDLYNTVKKEDKTRPATIVGVQGGPDEWIGIGDVISINRYYGWYTQQGDIEAGAKILSKELDDLHKKYNKPIVVTEFGADTYPGMHADQPEMFTEEYQRDFIKAYLDVMDSKDFTAGAHVWAFADFKTSQGVIRFGGMNWKGVFTRDRRPKLAAHYLKSRWNKN